MKRTEPCVLTNMVMIYDDCGNILVQDRRDPVWPGITFPGGHVEPGESFVRSAVREVKEETGLDIAAVRLCGVKQWTRAGEYRYIVFYYKTNCFSGTLKASDEGDVFWIPRDALEKYTLAEDFAEMIRVFENDDLSESYLFEDDNGWQLENL